MVYIYFACGLLSPYSGCHEREFVGGGGFHWPSGLSCFNIATAGRRAKPSKLWAPWGRSLVNYTGYFSLTNVRGHSIGIRCLLVFGNPCI